MDHLAVELLVTLEGCTRWMADMAAEIDVFEQGPTTWTESLPNLPEDRLRLLEVGL
jgi:hypothetical protein